MAFDVGKKRTGVAVSDPSGTLARPAGCLTSADQLQEAVALVERLRSEPEGLSAIVVGLPKRLDGSENEQTHAARAFAATLETRTGLPIVLQDERLTSVEAESRLAIRDRDWRRRKLRLDAASAAIILQDYLDARAVPALTSNTHRSIDGER
jgi:putative Holliday junction resolvase